MRLAGRHMNNTKIVLYAIGALLAVLVYRTMHPSTKFAADSPDPSWNEAATLSHESGQPAVVLFTADWCPACQNLHSNILSRDDVQHELNAHYIFYTVDLTDPSPEVAARSQKFGVRYIPLLIRYDKNGNETGRTNPASAEQLIEWLKDGE
jgi:thiol:disulfide interchange protein